MIFVIVLIIALSGILYELILGTLSSYLLGNSVLQFSLTIGFFMTGLGIGSFLARYFEEGAIKNFLRVELTLSFFGATAVFFLKMSYVHFALMPFLFQGVFIVYTLFLGILGGMEIPLIARIFQTLKIPSKSLISDIFTFDYIGALFASLLFPLFLLPIIGLSATALLVGGINVTAASLYIVEVKRRGGEDLSKYFIWIGVLFIIFLGLFIFGKQFENFFLHFYFKEPVLSSTRSDYQHIVLTKRGQDFRLYLNGNLQFLSLDEHRYHEALVDWPYNFLKNNGVPKNILVLGAGDGLAIRNLLQYNNISQITLVELDPAIIHLAKTHPDFLKLNKKSLFDPRVKIVTDDAFLFLGKIQKQYDMIIADFPDPSNEGTAKLYSQEFYARVFSRLTLDGIFVTQASNAFFASHAFASIRATIHSVFGNATGYHRYLPSFGDWGFIIAQKTSDTVSFTHTTHVLCPRYNCTFFDKDYDFPENIHINTLTAPIILEYYRFGWRKFNL